MNKGTTRVVYLMPKYAIKIARINKWNSFLRGLLANMDERLWYKNSPKEWKDKMCPSFKCLFGGLILICKRAEPITDDIWESSLIKEDDFYPIPVDWKKENLGLIKNRIVIIDYADTH